MEAEGFRAPDSTDSSAGAEVFVAVERSLVGAIRLADVLRPEAAAAVRN